MPVATSLPSNNVVIRFPPVAGPSNGAPKSLESADESYQLLELPNEILKAVEGKSEPFPLTIKGRPGDEAVLCTPSTTFLLRTVTLSNSLLICRTPKVSSARLTLEIRDVSHEILEPIPHAPNLERIRTLLKASAWRGLGEPLDLSDGEGSSKKRRRTGTADAEERKKRRTQRRYTRAQLESVIQASAVELDKGLRERYVIELDEKMLLLSMSHLAALVTILLALLTIHGDSGPSSGSGGGTKKTVTAPVSPILRHLEEDHELPRDLTLAVLKLLGTVQENSFWEANVGALVTVVGLSVLESTAAKDDGVAKDKFERMWREEVGEDWEDLVDLSLLEGHYLLIPPTSMSRQPLIKHFPAHALPLHAPTRFADLFLTKAKWRPDEMKPFLKGLVREGDTKEMDKLIAKFVRVVKEKEGVWWYPRRSS